MSSVLFIDYSFSGIRLMPPCISSMKCGSIMSGAFIGQTQGNNIEHKAFIYCKV